MSTPTTNTTTTATFEISGIHCPSCQMLITDILQDEGIKVTKFDADMKKKKATMIVATTLPAQKVMELVKSAGDYTIKQK